MSGIKLLTAIILLFFARQCQSEKIRSYSYSIPLAGNSWAENSSHRVITHQGLQNWDNPETVINTYFKTVKTGNLQLGIVAKISKGSSKVQFSLGRQNQTTEIKSTEFDTINIGNFKIKKAGYQQLSIQGTSKSGETYAEIKDILIGGNAAEGNVYFVQDEFYWGRRGPSVHLSYYPPETAADALWFYNEINVPEGEDVIGSYFMANGFGEGYFGIQVNSPNERRILFSVWSPYRTDNPNEIPEDQRITLLKKGPNVHAGKFGNEGSGGQSYKKFMWKAGTTYRFLLRGEPSENNCTDYTAYFFAPEKGEWELIASFRRPQTSTYLTRHHSFLENFIPDMGNISRKGLYQNQWICDKNGHWHEMTKARFIADNTARKQARMDYSGGVEDDKFFMKNCGFFDETTPIGTTFHRKPIHQKPKIDFDNLP